jgi:hypothetical protein
LNAFFGRESPGKIAVVTIHLHDSPLHIIPLLREFYLPTAIKYIKKSRNEDEHKVFPSGYLQN